MANSGHIPATDKGPTVRLEDDFHAWLLEQAVLNELIAESKACTRAVRDATAETEAKAEFPAESPWTLDQLLDSGFLLD